MVDMHLLQTSESLNLKKGAKFQIQTSFKLGPDFKLRARFWKEEADLNSNSRRELTLVGKRHEG